jgi:hypothetical protein
MVFRVSVVERGAGSLQNVQNALVDAGILDGSGVVGDPVAMDITKTSNE